MKKILLIEPFYGGSHKQLIDFLTEFIVPNNADLVTLQAKKWHWRARTSALYLSQVITSESKDILFCSSVLNLCELCGLRPDLARIPRKIVYFHENQLVYPKQTLKDRDFQYGYNQILTCTVADVILFNSQFNLDSFLDSLNSFLKTQPDYKPDVSTLKQQIQAKSRVLYFPVKLPKYHLKETSEKPLHILWPHRWEHDKNPQDFFEVLFKLKLENLDFRLSILGETFDDVPEIFNRAKIELQQEILHFGWLESKEQYFKVLQDAHVVISTAHHEFFGVAMLEAAAAGCLPLVPDRLVYPEIYPENCIYRTNQQLYKKLKSYCLKPYLAQHHWPQEKAKETCLKYSTEFMLSSYRALFE